MIQMIPRSKLEPHPDNPRKDLGDLSELAASIIKSGLLQNLTVVPHPDKPDMYRIIIGHRRFAASTIAGIDELPCTVEDMSYADQVATMLAENMQRNDLTIADQVSGIQLMIDLGESVKGIAEKTGISESSVRKRVSISQLPQKEMKQATSKGATLLDLLEVTKLEDKVNQAKVLKDFGTNNFMYSVRVARDDELRKKFRAEMLPQIYEKFPRIREVKNEGDVYNGRLKRVWECGYQAKEDRMDFPEYDPEKTYFLHDSRYFLGIYYEDPEWVKRKKDDGEGKARLKRRQMEAKEINQDAFEIRSYFVREFKVSNKTKHAEFFEKMLSEVFDWKP